jgi:hypothetical protein
MLFKGFLSFLQIGFLPGFLLLRAFKLRSNYPRMIIFSFALSLIANYCGVFLLTALKIYTWHVVYGIFFLEVALFMMLYFSQIKAWIFSSSAQFFSNWLESTYRIFIPYFDFRLEIEKVGLKNIIIKIVTLIFMVFACVSIAIVLIKFVKNSGTIFTSWDAVVSWNRWATDWFHNRLPVQTWHYPQLIPSNWSISYVFMNAPLQFVPKIVMPLFTLFILILMFDLGMIKKSFGYFVAIPVVTLIYKNAAFNITEGYVDIAVSFYSFLSVYCLIIAQKEEKKETAHLYLLLGGLIAAGAAVTKQAGLFIMVVYPILAFLMVIKNRTDFSMKDTLKLLFAFIGFVLVIVVPFYLYTEIRIKAGLEQSEICFVTKEIYHGKSLLQRFSDAIILFTSIFHNKYAFAGLVILLIFALFEKSYYWVAYIIVVPFMVIWAFYYSYDFRNFALAVPFISLGIGIGAERLLSLSISIFDKIKNRTILSLFVLLALLLNFHFDASYLQNRQYVLEKKIGNAALNDLLYQYKEKNDILKKVMTNYSILSFLPDFKDVYYLQHFEIPDEEELHKYFQNIKNGEIGYILLPDNADKTFLSDVKQRIKTKEFDLIFHAEGYTFLIINRHENL